MVKRRHWRATDSSGWSAGWPSVEAQAQRSPAVSRSVAPRTSLAPSEAVPSPIIFIHQKYATPACPHHTLCRVHQHAYPWVCSHHPQRQPPSGIPPLCRTVPCHPHTRGTSVCRHTAPIHRTNNPTHAGPHQHLVGAWLRPARSCAEGPSARCARDSPSAAYFAAASAGNRGVCGAQSESRDSEPVCPGQREGITVSVASAPCRRSLLPNMIARSGVLEVRNGQGTGGFSGP